MSSWLQKQWDSGVALVKRHPRKSTALGLAGAWYQAVGDGLEWFAGFLPTWDTVRNSVSVVSWPDWSVTWVTGPVGTLLLALIWRQSRHGEVLPPPAPVVLGEWDEDGQRFQSAEETVNELREELQGVNAQRNAAIRERDAALDAVATCNKQFSLARLRWFKERVETNIAKAREEGKDLKGVRVTVRFAVYDDVELAQQIQAILKEHTEWPVELDGSNKPTLMPDKKHGFKVIFDVGPMDSFSEIASAFDDGGLVKARIGMRRTERWGEPEHLIVEVLPTTP